MPCPMLKGNKQKTCSAAEKIVVPCIEELNNKCLNDRQYANCEQYRKCVKLATTNV